MQPSLTVLEEMRSRLCINTVPELGTFTEPTLLLLVQPPENEFTVPDELKLTTRLCASPEFFVW